MAGRIGRAVVTGGAGGLGKALALELASRGASVVIADINEEMGEATVGELVSKGHSAWFVKADMAELDQIEALADRSAELMGGIDFLANNAGVAVAGPFTEVSVEDWKWVMDINLWGVIHGARVFLPHLERSGRGHLLNVASMAGLTPGPEMGPYNVTKAGVVGMSETLHTEYLDRNVHVTVLCPFFFKTNIAQSGRGPKGMATEEARRKKQIEKLMNQSKVQAPEVAKRAIDGVIKNEVYVLPHGIGRTFWGIKRATPQFFPRVLRAATRRGRRR